ncbi:MAG: polysaccharide deacetylase family protein [Acidobacteriota bacterium]
MNEGSVKILEPQTAGEVVGETPSFAARARSWVKAVFFFIYLYCGYVQLRDYCLALLGRSRAVVLYYHRLGKADVLTRAPEQFSEDLNYLKQHYDCISLRELCQRLQSKQAFRRRAVVITFDDGYRDNYLLAAPMLKKAGITATFFVSTGYMGTERDFLHDLRDEKEVSEKPLRFPKLTWDDLREMEREGFEIGSHTVNHTNMGKTDKVSIEREIVGSLAMLNCELNERPRAFSFPWGKPDDISDYALEIVRQAGYYTAVSAYGGSNTRGANLFNIHRVDVGNGELSRLAMRARVAGFDPDFYRLKLKNRNI